MIRSLSIYTKNLLKIAANGNLDYVTADLLRYFRGEAIFRKIPKASAKERETALHHVIRYLVLAQEKMEDRGIGSFHLATGWGSTYPETTGYIIPSLLTYARLFDKDLERKAALEAASFLLEIQKPSGGWQGGRVNENKPEVVFNTGQVLRGLQAAFEETGDERFLEGAKKGADWLCSIQHPEGYWKKNALMNQARVYDAFVDAPLLHLHRLTGDNRYQEAALRNLSWIVTEKMQKNGWFEDCDNTIKRNSRPILHTIAYTIDGLLESDSYLQEGRFTAAATIAADELKKQLLHKGRLYGRYDRDWEGSEFFLCTGAAQMAMAWQRLYRLTSDPSYLEAADRALDILIFVQRRSLKERTDTQGALPGSFPIWGRYEPFAFPNWASKFFADALMMRIEADREDVK